MNFGLTILDWAAKAGIMMLLAGIAVSCCGKRPKLRRLIWVCAFIGSLLLPLANAIPVNAPAFVRFESATAPAPFSEPMPSAAVDYLPIVWLVGACLTFGWIGAGYVGLCRAIKRSQPLPSSLENLPSAGWGRSWTLRIAGSARIAGPFTFGCFRPVILLPNSANGWTEEQLRAVTLHELAHIRNLDSGVLVVAYLLSALLWFNPLVWFALHALRNECEAAADEAALDAGLVPSAYARVLLSLTKEMAPSRPVRLAPSLARAPGIERRIRTIVADHRSRPLKAWQRVGTVALCAIMMGAGASFRIAAAQASPLARGGPLQTPSEAWQRGYDYGRAYAAAHAGAKTPYKPRFSPQEKLEIERNLQRNLGPPKQ